MSGAAHRVSVQTSAGAHVEIALLRHISLVFIGLAIRKRIVHGLLECCLGVLGVIALMDHLDPDELVPPMEHPVIIAIPDRAGITLLPA